MKRNEETIEFLRKVKDAAADCKDLDRYVLVEAWWAGVNRTIPPQLQWAKDKALESIDPEWAEYQRIKRRFEELKKKFEGIKSKSRRDMKGMHDYD